MANEQCVLSKIKANVKKMLEKNKEKNTEKKIFVRNNIIERIISTRTTSLCHVICNANLSRMLIISTFI